jgi:hypothetical protein
LDPLADVDHRRLEFFCIGFPGHIREDVHNTTCLGVKGFTGWRENRASP